MVGKGATARDEFASLRTIGEVADHLGLPQHVLRFWETRFKEIDPVKRAGGRRFYRPRDIALVEAIRCLLYREGYTIKGVQRILKERGVDAVIADVRRRQSGEQPSPIPAPRPEPQLELGLREGDSPEPTPEPIPFEAQPELEPSDEAPPRVPETPHPPPAVVTPVFNAPVVVSRHVQTEQAELLRHALAQIAECKRLLNLTKR